MFLVFLLFVQLLMMSCSYHRFGHKPRNEDCNCVPQHLCEDDDAAINGHGLLEPRISNRICSDPSETCCNSPPKSTPSKVMSSNGDIPLCGLSSTIKSRITSSTIAAFGELPWNLIIQENGGDEPNIYKGGASLIHPKVAITAAHTVASYVEQPDKIIVRAGEWNIASLDEPLPFEDNFVEQILIHYDYHAASLKNDIAILILSEEFSLRDNVRPICLSTPNELVDKSRCIASGWGKNAKMGSFSSTLRKVQVPIVSRSFCLETLRSTKLGPTFRLHKSFICAGGKNGKDACKGDGGSPLICPLLEDGTRFVQVGIVSWGIGCGVEGVPGVYVNVPLYLDWIEEVVGDMGLDTGFFKM